MSNNMLATHVGELVTANPSRSRVFERLGIDYCCQGKLSLADACAKKGLNPEFVVSELERAISTSRTRDWSKASLTELCENIERTHHAYLKQELPRLNQLAKKVATRHGDADARLKKIEATLAALTHEMLEHMQKEEHILFPMIRQMERANGSVEFHCGSICNPIRVMEMEHQQAGDGLSLLRELSDNYLPPEWACPTYRALLDGLAQLESDMHTHVHKENSILFPGAIAREEQFSASMQ